MDTKGGYRRKLHENQKDPISEAAYYKAEQRGFQPGNEMADWFEAEADVARMLGEPSGTGACSR